MLEFFLSVVSAGSKVVHQVGGGAQVTFGRLDLVMMVQHVMPTRWCLVMILSTGWWW